MSCRHTQDSCSWAASGHQKTSQISPAVTACCHTLRPHFLRPDPFFLTGWLRRMCVHWREKWEERKKIPMTLHFTWGKWTFPIVRGWRRGLQTVLALFWNSVGCLHNKDELDSLALEPDFSVFRLNTGRKNASVKTRWSCFLSCQRDCFHRGKLLMALCSLSSATYLSAPPPRASDTALCACGGSRRLSPSLMSTSEIWHERQNQTILRNRQNWVSFWGRATSTPIAPPACETLI